MSRRTGCFSLVNYKLTLGATVRARNAFAVIVVTVACRSSGYSAGTGAVPTANPTAAYDVVIENGRIVDGTGTAWYYGDLAIRGDRIVAIVPRGMLRDAHAAT